ncbi:MAG: hypothetical protein R2725_02365 [Solirubrobacterales bacterium]
MKLTEERYTWVWLVAAMVISAVTALWFGRQTTFWVDDVTLFMLSPSFDLKTAFEPHLGHLVLVPHVVYKTFFELFGASYFPFRLLTVIFLMITTWLLFVWVRRRLGGFAALGPCVLMLFFGADYFHIITGNGWGLLLAISCGVGAFLAIERGDRRGDAIACGLLCLGVATYSVALGFLAGAALWLVLGRQRRRLWVVAIPAALYLVWWTWTKTLPPSPEGNFHLENIVLLPAWGFQTLSAMLQAASGLSYQYEGGNPAPSVGPVLAIGVLAAIGLRLLVGRVTPALWGALGAVVGLWALGAVTAGGIRFPENPRYFIPLFAALVLVFAESYRGRRVGRNGLIALYVVFGLAVGVNFFVLRDGGVSLRAENTPIVRASLSAFEIAGPSAQSRFELVHPDGTPAIEQGGIGVPIRILEAQGRSPARSYEEAVARYGRIGFSEDELAGQPDVVGATTDALLAEAEGVKLEPAPARAGLKGCDSGTATDGIPAVLHVPEGGAWLELRGAAADLTLGRFAGVENVPLGTASASTPLALKIPEDRSAVPWRIAAPAGTLIVCPLR